MVATQMTRRAWFKKSVFGGSAAIVLSGSSTSPLRATLQHSRCGTGVPMLVKACLNGGRMPQDTPYVPISAEETAAAAKDAVAAGAGAVHIHVRARNGRQSIEPSDVARILTAVRTAVPGIPAGISTASGIQPDPERRHKIVESWTVLPDFCSVNIREPGSLRLAELLLARGVGVEAGLNEPRHVQMIVESGLAPDCVRMLMEPHSTSAEDEIRLANEMETALDSAGSRVRRLFHGSGVTAWRFMDLAIARGYELRIGIEDVLTLPNDNTPATNAMLVAEAVRRVRAAC